MERRSSIADSEVARGDYAAAVRTVREWDDNYGGAERPSPLPYDARYSASGWAVSPVYQEDSARPYDRYERRRYDDRARGAAPSGRLGGRSGSVDSDNRSSSASDVERGSGSETETEDSPLRGGRGVHSRLRRTVPRDHYGESSDVTRAGATRRSSYRGRGSGFHDTEEESRYTDTTLSVAGSRSGSDSGGHTERATAVDLRNPHWTEKSNYKHDRHLMARASGLSLALSRSLSLPLSLHSPHSLTHTHTHTIGI